MLLPATRFATSYCSQMLDWNRACVFRSLESPSELRTCSKDCFRPTDRIHPGSHCQKSRGLLGGSIWLRLPAATAVCWEVSTQLSCAAFPLGSSNETLIHCGLCKETTYFQRTSLQAHALAAWRTGKTKEDRVKSVSSPAKGWKLPFSLSPVTDLREDQIKLGYKSALKPRRP